MSEGDKNLLPSMLKFHCLLIGTLICTLIGVLGVTAVAFPDTASVPPARLPSHKGSTTQIYDNTWEKLGYGHPDETDPQECAPPVRPPRFLPCKNLSGPAQAALSQLEFCRLIHDRSAKVWARPPPLPGTVRSCSRASQASARLLVPDSALANQPPASGLVRSCSRGLTYPPVPDRASKTSASPRPGIAQSWSHYRQTSQTSKKTMPVSRNEPRLLLGPLLLLLFDQATGDRALRR